MKTSKNNHSITRGSHSPGLDFTSLVSAIQKVHEQSAEQAKRAVNTGLTLRNWLIGAYLAEYELNGSDRADYGDGVFLKLASSLRLLQVTNTGKRQLYQYLAFYRHYPQIVRTLSAPFVKLMPIAVKSNETAERKHSEAKVRTLSAQSKIQEEQLLSKLSYSHFEQLVAIDDPIKRSFYEVECLRGNWSVRALKRQISSLYFERSGLSKNKEKLSALANEGAEKLASKLSIRDPYIFEFLGLRAQDAMVESDLEQALLDNVQAFLLELGHGFCLEARQKCILIGNTRGYVDMVFYHRILSCHVLIELKVDQFRHEHIGQLNTYVAWYQKNMMQTGDNPPIGLLLCTGKDHAMVEYALSGMSDRLFVSKYQLALPSTEDLQKFIDQKRAETIK